MAEGESKPKTNKSKDWLAYADKKEKQFRDHHSKTNMFGRLKNPQPLGDDYSRLLSNNALEARTTGMKLKRDESLRTHSGRVERKKTRAQSRVGSR